MHVRPLSALASSSSHWGYCGRNADGKVKTMAKHTCGRCGFEVTCLHGRWWDRHPFAAVLLALPTLYTLAGVILAYPWFFVPLLLVALVGWVDRRNRRRTAIAARADYEYRQEMLRAMRAPGPAGVATPVTHPLPTAAERPSLTVGTGRIARRHVLNRWPTTPVLTEPIQRNR